MADRKCQKMSIKMICTKIRLFAFCIVPGRDREAEAVHRTVTFGILALARPVDILSFPTKCTVVLALRATVYQPPEQSESGPRDEAVLRQEGTGPREGSLGRAVHIYPGSPSKYGPRSSLSISSILASRTVDEPSCCAMSVTKPLTP